LKNEKVKNKEEKKEMKKMKKMKNEERKNEENEENEEKKQFGKFLLLPSQISQKDLSYSQTALPLLHDLMEMFSKEISVSRAIVLWDCHPSCLVFGCLTFLHFELQVVGFAH